jgi:apolipoprotein N-acyltransferase
MEQDVLLRKVHRQLRWLNVMMTFFSLVSVAGFIIMCLLLYKVYTYAHNAESKVDSLQSNVSQSLNVKSDACSNGTITSILKSQGVSC